MQKYEIFRKYSEKNVILHLFVNEKMTVIGV